ncbi:hypothetical protein [Candidatus Hodarchaeum mangrovi]
MANLEKTGKTIDLNLKKSQALRENIETEILSLLEKKNNASKLIKYANSESIYTGPNMAKVRDNFRSHAAGIRMHRYF